MKKCYWIVMGCILIIGIGCFTASEIQKSHYCIITLEDGSEMVVRKPLMDIRPWKNQQKFTFKKSYTTEQ
jgi:hypothetical protein